MSGSIVSGIDYSVLFNAANDTSITGQLLSSLYGTGAQATQSGPAALAALTSAESNQKADIAAQEKQPLVARDIAAFKAALATARTPAELLANPGALKVLLTANGLGSQAAYPALAQKILLSDPANTNSLVNQINATNSNWLPVAKTYQFATKGLAVLKDPKVQQTLVDAYAEVSWRQSLDAKTPGLSQALTFLANAPSVKTADDILGDATLRAVVSTAFDIPQQIAFQPLEAQERAVTDKVDLTRLKDPKYLHAIVQQFLLNNASASSGSSTPTLDQIAAQANGLTV